MLAMQPFLGQNGLAHPESLLHMHPWRHQMTTAGL